MFVVNDDNSIYATRGDIVFFYVSAKMDGAKYTFQPGDVVRIKVFAKKDCEDVVLQKDFGVEEATETVAILLDESDTKFGEVISKPRDYWYEVELNPDTNPQTIVGYDEDGPRVLKLFPEGKDIPEMPVEPETVKVMDAELDLTSNRPVENRAIARAIARLDSEQKHSASVLTGEVTALKDAFKANSKDIGVERARIDNLIAHKPVTLSQKLDYLDFITEATKAKIDGTVNSDGVFASVSVNWREANQIYGGTELDMFIIPAVCRPMEAGLIHTEDGLEYRIKYDGTNNRYYMSIKAQSDVTVAPSGAGVVTMSYALGDYELRDVRVGADGQTYESAGAAVRGQVEGLFEACNSSFCETGYANKYISACKVLTNEYEYLMLSDIRRNYDGETGFRIYSCDETGKDFEYVSTVTLSNDFVSGNVEHRFGGNSLLCCYLDLTELGDGGRRTGDGKPFVLKRDCFLPVRVEVNELSNTIFAACNTEPKKILTWVDDDTPVDGIASVKAICDSLGIKCTFATITQGWTEPLLELLRQYQGEGFHITSHTESHGRWYKDMPEGDVFNAGEMEADLLVSLEKMRAEGFRDCDMLVYPGSAVGRSDVNTIGIVKKWCKCGVLAGGTTWSKYGQGKYKINRTFIAKSSHDTAYYTDLLDAVTDEGWVVFGTHSGSTTDFDADMVSEILAYALAHGWAIMTLNEALKYREKYYHIQEVFGL